MSRYVSDVPTGLSDEESGRVAADYLTSEGFTYRDERGEMVWRKGTGAAVIPQFVTFHPGAGVVHVEAWVAGASLLPGVYGGEQDLNGFYGWAAKAPLKKRVAELERRIAAGAPVSGAQSTGTQPASTQTPASASAPAGWYDDPQKRHQSRYWDGSRWTENCADDGATVIDPV